ncbi:hypothetical protein N7540_000827 [Penicillium herquei]|nr:hypothetical protein N7540_000827 [Penicillium herquei]
MTDPLRPGLQPISHLKAGPTTSSSRSTALPSNHQPLQRPASRLRTQRTTHREDVSDGTSERATSALIRRVLCPQTSSHGASSPQPLGELLPPLTSSNDVDRQLYAILAIIFKEFVYSWYSKITPDQALVNEILHVVAHCTRALEQRIRDIDAAQLLLDEIPALVEAHIISYRLSKQQSYLSGLPTSHRALYHELNPHPGLSPVPDSADPETITAQSENEAVYRRLLAHGALAVLLPTEELENSSLRTLVGDIIADLILGKEVGGRVCEPVFFYEIITKLTVIMKDRKSPTDTSPANDISTNRLEKFGLLSDSDESASPSSYSQSQATAWMWKVLQFIYLGYVALRFIATGLFRVASNPEPGCSHGAIVSFPAATPESPKEGVASSLSDSLTNKRPILDYRVASMVSQLFGVSQRMPWFSGLIALFQYLILAGPGQLGDTDGVLDRFLRETIEEYILPPTLLPNLLLATRSTLFPANARPASVAVSVGNSGAPVLTPHVSVPSLTSSGKALTISASAPSPVPNPAGDKVVPTGVAGNNSVDKINAGSNSQVSGIGLTTNSTSSGGAAASNNGGDHQLPTVAILSPGSIISEPTADTNKLPTASPTGSDKQPSSAVTEIAAIKRQCAANLLALIPRNIAQTFFGVPASPRGDRTCSTTTGSSSLLTTSISPSPPTEKEGDGGHQTRRSSSQGHTRTSPLISDAKAASTMSRRESGAGSGETIAAEKGLPRTHEHGDEAEIAPEELCLLEMIETDLLDILADEYCNKHLIYSILETVLAKVLPELAERSVADLMEDRGVSSIPSTF